jgi:hypothetical protein
MTRLGDRVSDGGNGRADRLGIRLLVGAATVGLLHAAFTMSWAAGSRWLLRTVGEWAVELADRSPAAAAVGLGAVALVKVAGAVVPVLVETRSWRGRRWWRGLAWAGAVVLIGYGSVNVLVSWAVLSGWLVPVGGYDAAAQWGHAALWDPLFLLWGVLLAAGLTRTSTRTGAVTRSGRW